MARPPRYGPIGTSARLPDWPPGPIRPIELARLEPDWYKVARIRALSLLFFAALLPQFAASLLRIVVTSLLLFDVASVLRAFVASASRC